MFKTCCTCKSDAAAVCANLKAMPKLVEIYLYLAGATLSILLSRLLWTDWNIRKQITENSRRKTSCHSLSVF